MVNVWHLPLPLLLLLLLSGVSPVSLGTLVGLALLQLGAAAKRLMQKCSSEAVHFTGCFAGALLR